MRNAIVYTTLTILLAALVYVGVSSDGPAVHGAALQGLPGPNKNFKVGQPAHDLVGGTDWFNTDNPISLADLKGRIVLLDFWTLCCINCIHTLPDLARLEARYPGVLVVIGVHSPKFDNEKKSASIFKAILRYEIKHPVINDADRKLWKAWNVDTWPTLILIDPDGNYRGFARGEGNLEVADKNIRELIKEYTAKGTLKKDVIKFDLLREKTASPLLFPGKVLADAPSKRLFIADSTNHRIVITNLEGKKIAIAGNGKEGLKDGKFAEAEFSDPQGMALNGDILYVADRKNHAIRALDLKNETVRMVAGTGENFRVFEPQGKTRPALKFGLASPWDVMMFNKRLYIAMAGHNQIYAYDPAKETVTIYAGAGREDLIDGPIAKACFAQPSGLATDGKRIFVADCEVSAIRSVPLPGTVGNVFTIVGEGLFEFGDRNGIGKQVRLQHALGVVYYDTMLYVADTYNNKIKLIDPVKKSCATWLVGEKILDEPGGLSIAAGKMYIADTNNHRIQVVDMKTKDLTTLKLDGVTPVARSGAASSSLEKSKN